MKKTAGRGTWKTPPSVIYAEPAAASAPGGPLEAPKQQPFGTKAHLLGLGSRSPAQTTSDWAYSAAAAAPAVASPALPNEPLSYVVEAPPPPPPAPVSADASSPPAQRNFGSPANPPALRGRGRGRGRVKATSPGVEAPSPATTSSPPMPQKSAELARLRQLAKLRREIQRSTTDNLELEMAELCEIKAYISACARGAVSDAPAFGRIASQGEALAAKREALEKAVGIVKASANSTRSQDSHYQELESLASPEAHPLVSRGDAFDRHLACLVGTRREARSLVPERRQMSVQWAADQVRHTVSELVQDALPLAGVLLLVSPSPQHSLVRDALVSALNLSPAQLATLSAEREAILADMHKVLELEQETNSLLAGPLWQQYSEQLVEKLRDCMSIQQMNDFIAWENVDEELD